MALSWAVHHCNTVVGLRLYAVKIYTFKALSCDLLEKMAFLNMVPPDIAIFKHHVHLLQIKHIGLVFGFGGKTNKYF